MNKNLNTLRLLAKQIKIELVKIFDFLNTNNNLLLKQEIISYSVELRMLCILNTQNK